MKRKTVTPRRDWRKKVEEQGLIFHSPEDESSPYWNESAYYEFTAAQVDELEAATNDLQQMCLRAVQHVIDKDLFQQMSIPAEAIPVIISAWKNEPPSIYGRFDFAYDGKNPPKLLEYNADTPTSLLEAAVVQWYWLQDCFPDADQFNSIHERLVAKWKSLKSNLKEPVYFANLDNDEDWMTTAYLRDTADQAGLHSEGILMQDIGWSGDRQQFVDLKERPMFSLFKLYPWEHMLADEFGKHALLTYGQVNWIEPIWKMVLSNKSILPILWELNPNHPNLLESFFDSPRWLSTYARKPKLGREGANVTLTTNSGTLSTAGEYGKEGFIYQALADVPSFDGNYAVIGSWVVDGEAAGMGIRESNTPITDNTSRFLPHLFR
jgi:glutathionylspermidine synthase